MRMLMLKVWASVCSLVIFRLDIHKDLFYFQLKPKRRPRRMERKTIRVIQNSRPISKLPSRRVLSRARRRLRSNESICQLLLVVKT